MGLVTELGYDVPSPKALQRASWCVASSRPGAWMLSRMLPPVDRLLIRRSGGQVSIPQVVSGLPIITLVTVGARSGERRESPLLGVPHGDNMAVIGTAFGQPATPAWWHNLRAHPEVEVIYKARSVPARAREATPEEARAIWERGRSLYAGYEAYARRLTGRPVHIAVLEATQPK